MGKRACPASAVDENERNEVPTRNTTKVKELLLLLFVLSRADGGIKVIIIMC